MYSYPATAMIGAPISRILPAERVVEMPTILAGIAAGERFTNLETERTCRDGSWLHVSLTILPMLDAAGRFVGASSIGRDISARIHAQAERERLRAEVFSRAREVAALLEITEALNAAASENAIVRAVAERAAALGQVDYAGVVLCHGDQRTLTYLRPDGG